jgi:hypothetical protein
MIVQIQHGRRCSLLQTRTGRGKGLRKSLEYDAALPVDEALFAWLRS